ncbi:MAG: hypothetical protein ACI9BF_000323 [Candidatus Paceibacteria bacterium]|jgi:hypothetical protein
MESYKTSENRGEIMDGSLNILIQSLSGSIKEEVPIEYIDGTYEIDGEQFTLTFTVDDDFFEIRSIDAHDNPGMDSEILSVIHNYADENSLDVIASNVLATARGFWEKMGYQEGGDESVYFREV